MRDLKGRETTMKTDSRNDAKWKQLNADGVAAYKGSHFGAAEQLFRAAIQEAEKLGANDLRVASSLDSLAVVLEAQQKYEEVVPCYHRSQDIREHLYGSWHQEFLDSVLNLAEFYLRRGNYMSAERICDVFDVLAMTAEKYQAGTMTASINECSAYVRSKLSELKEKGFEPATPDFNSNKKQRLLPPVASFNTASATNTTNTMNTTMEPNGGIHDLPRRLLRSFRSLSLYTIAGLKQDQEFAVNNKSSNSGNLTKLPVTANGEPPEYLKMTAEEQREEETLQALIAVAAMFNASQPGAPSQGRMPAYMEGAVLINALESWAGSGKTGKVKRALLNGIDVNAHDERGMTALHYAVRCGEPRVVELLLKSHANVLAQSRSGETPIDLATAAHNDSLLKLMLEHAIVHC
jgi:tetratricopeptide (TPR) repeat protein